MIRNLKFEFDDNTLSFNFVGMDYSDPKNVQLAYKMEGIDDNWVILNKGDQGFARYSNLPPNQYVFKVKAANSDGVWSDGYRSISILIRPPWYQTVEAYILFGITGLLLLYGGYRIRVRQIRKEEAFKRKEAEYKQLVAETETAVLRLQMNPHFIFNSMNSISSYIAQKDIKTANDYLNRFANLMRKILKLAKHPFLSVGEEMELLEQYLETEAMRFEDKIHYQITTGPSLDPDEVIIPTMILQPFVENAIWHGLAGKEGRKQIHIQFKIEKEQLICIVEDNGIGRAAAQVKKKSNNHVSKAISITKERLKRLEEQEAAAASLTIQDLKDEQHTGIGTKVIIKLPLIE